MIKFTEDQKQFIYNNYKGLGNKELTRIINEKFKTELTYEQVKNFKNRHRLNSGLTGQFQKGHIHDKTWDEYMSKDSQERSRRTTFKKGNIPSNRRKIFDERISKDGYIEIKVQDGCLNGNWKHKHRYIYEQNYGEIPKGYKVIFLDGNIYNFEINNLKLVSNAEELIMNSNNLRYSKAEFTETGHLIAQVLHKRSKLKNERL